MLVCRAQLKWCRQPSPSSRIGSILAGVTPSISRMSSAKPFIFPKNTSCQLPCLLQEKGGELFLKIIFLAKAWFSLSFCYFDNDKISDIFYLLILHFLQFKKIFLALFFLSFLFAQKLKQYRVILLYCVH
jgi:hypothetical protein